jgi:uncharacterized protein (TIGR02266 family)
MGAASSARGSASPSSPLPEAAARVSTKPPSRAQLLLPIKDRQTFLEQSFDKGEAGGLFVPGELEVSLGDEVDVEIHFVEDQVRFHIRGIVKWKRELAGRRAIPPGVGIEFLPSEADTREHLILFAQGRESVNHVERDRRYALQVDVKLRQGAMELTGITDDISEGGCFVKTDLVLPVGTVVDVKLKAPGSLFGWMTVPAAVAWTRSDKHRTGVGLAFHFEGDKQRAKMKKIVALLKERMVRELHVKTPRLSPSTPPTRA